MNRRKGFSLVLVILIFAAIGMVAVGAGLFSARVKTINNEHRTITRLLTIRDAAGQYFRGRESMPDTTGTEVPVGADRLNLEQKYQNDAWGRPIEYRTVSDINGMEIVLDPGDAIHAAGYALSGGPDQVIDSVYEPGSPRIRRLDDDIIVSINVRSEAIEIAREELIVLTRKQKAFCAAAGCYYDWDAGAYDSTAAGPADCSAQNPAFFLDNFALAQEQAYARDPWGEVYLWDDARYGFYSKGPDQTAGNNDDVSAPPLTACSGGGPTGAPIALDEFADVVTTNLAFAEGEASVSFTGGGPGGSPQMHMSVRPVQGDGPYLNRACAWFSNPDGISECDDTGACDFSGGARIFFEFGFPGQASLYGFTFALLAANGVNPSSDLLCGFHTQNLGYGGCNTGCTDDPSNPWAPAMIPPKAAVEFDIANYAPFRENEPQAHHAGIVYWGSFNRERCDCSGTQGGEQCNPVNIGDYYDDNVHAWRDSTEQYPLNGLCKPADAGYPALNSYNHGDSPADTGFTYGPGPSANQNQRWLLARTWHTARIDISWDKGTGEMVIHAAVDPPENDPANDPADTSADYDFSACDPGDDCYHIYDVFTVPEGSAGAAPGFRDRLDRIRFGFTSAFGSGGDGNALTVRRFSMHLL